MGNCAGAETTVEKVPAKSQRRSHRPNDLSHLREVPDSTYKLRYVDLTEVTSRNDSIIYRQCFLFSDVFQNYHPRQQIPLYYNKNRGEGSVVSRSVKQPKQRRRTYGEASSRASDYGSDRGSAVHLGTLDYLGGSEYGGDEGRERQRRMGSFLSCDGGGGYTQRGGSRGGGDHYNDMNDDGSYSRGTRASFSSQNGGHNNFHSGGRRGGDHYNDSGTGNVHARGTGGSFSSNCDGESVYSRGEDHLSGTGRGNRNLLGENYGGYLGENRESGGFHNQSGRTQCQDTKESDLMEKINEEDDEDDEGKDVEEKRFGDHVQHRPKGSRPIGQTPVKQGSLFYM